MKSPANSFLFALIVGVSICSTAAAHDSACEARILAQLGLQTVPEQARLARFYGQREAIQLLENNGENFRNLTRAYRSLIQDLFNCDAVERSRLIRLVFPTGSILSRLDMSLQAGPFTEDLIRLMSGQMGHEMVLAKLRAFADLEADKLTGY